MRKIDPIDKIALMEKLGIGKECTVCEQNSDPYCMWKPDVVDVCEAICTAPTVESEPQIIYSKAGYIMSLHKEYGCTLTRAEEAHNKALEYLRDKAMMKG